ncbi:MAG: hypothetical protein HPM95_13070 [Alphaproteobacteria bacterium]|nr:hypothetical protein [Alphaproteobacteria bacterium]
MIPTVAREIRTLRKSVDALNRRLAASHMTGKVVEIKGDKVRLELMPPDPRTGKPFLSPWVQVQESAGDGVGGYSTHCRSPSARPCGFSHHTAKSGRNRWPCAMANDG